MCSTHAHTVPYLHSFIDLRESFPLDFIYELCRFSALRIIVKVAATFTWVFGGYGLRSFKTFKDFPRSKGQIHHPLQHWCCLELRFHGLSGIDKFLRPDTIASLGNHIEAAVGGAKAERESNFTSTAKERRKPFLYFGGKRICLIKSATLQFICFGGS